MSGFRIPTVKEFVCPSQKFHRNYLKTLRSEIFKNFKNIFFNFKAEVTTLFGTEPVTEAASQYDKKFLCSEHIKPVDLKFVCQHLAARGNNIGGYLCPKKVIGMNKSLNPCRYSSDSNTVHPITGFSPDN